MRPSPPRRALRLSLRAVAATITASAFAVSCTSGHDLGETATARQAVEEGEIDHDHLSVFRVVTRTSGSTGLCTATLIAPNLLLTARHCVAETNTVSIECNTATFHDAIGTNGLLFSNDTAPEIGSRWFAPSEVIVDEGTRDVCGNDIALIRLDENVPASVAQPSSPRFRPEPEAGELYSAVGYGASSDVSLEAEFGVRHARSELPVRCGGAGCGDVEILENEFSGIEGVCKGDSGGPALDLEGRVLGVLSRGHAGCLSPVYTSVSAFETWIVEHAERAAELGDYALPEWAGGEPPADPNSGPPTRPTNEAHHDDDDENPSRNRLDDESGCRMSPTPSKPSALRELLPLAGLGLLLRRRRAVGRSGFGRSRLGSEFGALFLWLAGTSACSNEAPLGEVNERSASSPDAGAESESEAETEPTEPIADYTASVRANDVVTTPVYSIQTHQTTDVPTTRRAESDNAVVFVANDGFDDIVTDEHLNGFLHRLEKARGTAKGYTPDRGVLATNEVVFGELPRDTLPEGKLRIFIVDTEGAGEGYLCGWCDPPTDLHLDGDLIGPLDGDLSLSITAHELFHVIHRNYDPDEVTWVDESLGQAAMSANGFYTDRRWLSSFVDDPNQNWGPGGADVRTFNYGAGLAYGTYLWEQGGPELMRAITREPANHWTGIDLALASIGEPRTAFELFLEMGVALYYDDPERGFGFDAFNPPGRVPRTLLPAGENDERVLQPYGFIYYRFEGSGSVLVESADDVHALLVADTEENAQLVPEAVPLGVTVDVVKPALLLVTATEAATFRVTRAQ